MNKKSFLYTILFGLITIIIATSCDKDFNELGTDIVDDEHFGFDVDSLSTIKSFNQKLGPIASNNLAINPLGFYNNPAFGTTKANFVTQVELSSINPVFNNTNTELYQALPTIDSVILDVPYYRTVKSVANEISTYRLDSIYGVDASKFKLSIYESGYYLRDLDPDQSLNEAQLFYTDQNNDIENNKVDVLLNDKFYADGHENEMFYFDKKEHVLKTYNADGVTPVFTRFPPSMRLHLRSDVFYNKIVNGPSAALSSQALFKNYFRGLYFKVDNGNPGNMAMLNFKNGAITLYYKEDKITPDNANTTNVNEFKVERVSKSYALNLSGNSISLLQNSNEDPTYLTAATSSQEASKLYLKGGEGSMAIIDLFGTTDVKGYALNPGFNSNLPIDPLTNPKYTIVNSPNGISDEIDEIKFKGWLINEANLTFYVDKPAMSDSKAVEPNRIYLYDLTNKKTLVDYSFDFSADGVYNKRNKYVFGGILLNEDGSISKQKKNPLTDIVTEKGYKYKIRITNHIRNLIRNDSTNVRLGLSVTETIANIGLSKLKTANSYSNGAPTMSVMNPLGTILYGTNVPVGLTQEYKKRLKLQIYYTKPN
ncbi:DUF4270 domain-containing protein [Flavobacterium sp.]|uniref:DUF4270 domain-containing protein n=1 Tax=Flavobacterium sp. TaxID=239 RepID=UPI0024882266|nr:DUF4270 domain-containing protein [Flavobacterium sp.]MDI1318366.1 DUF4270 domain-containing protein [Flavobacterium sp.]